MLLILSIFYSSNQGMRYPKGLSRRDIVFSLIKLSTKIAKSDNLVKSIYLTLGVQYFSKLILIIECFNKKLQTSDARNQKDGEKTI